MKKITLLVACITLIISCKQKQEIIEKPESSIEKENLPVEITPSLNYVDLVVVLSENSNLTEAQMLLKNNNLTIDKILIDEDYLKAGLVKVPENDKEEWKNKLSALDFIQGIEKNSKNILNTINDKYDNRLITINKTPCFGDCPVYNVVVKKNGLVTFNGIKNVLNKGLVKFQLDNQQLQILNEKFSKIVTNNYKPIYDSRNPDLPSTNISFKGTNIKIRLWKEVPLELIEVHEYIIEHLLDKKYIE
ncbi:DUF6438 domain-containing protein [Urechidicola croceus]|uniref:DUF6438 domain-containing protein n=1 Tax=Urechidicola croceus TaxID=1850246 RepID=A0A1D8P5Y0_9FLAO|nr:DUF6438 domain-containing protein [Urechidicola croceus]AOW19988.1 hypothetical protein LPB138_04495 [Urechidicola croceus]